MEELVLRLSWHKYHFSVVLLTFLKRQNGATVAESIALGLEAGCTLGLIHSRSFCVFATGMRWRTCSLAARRAVEVHLALTHGGAKTILHHNV